MKKLLVLMLVLGMATVSFGALAALEVDTAGDIYPGDVVTISLYADYTAAGFGIRQLTDDVTPMGSFTVGTVFAGFNLGVKDGTGFVVNSGNVLVQATGQDAIAGSAFSLTGGYNCPAGTALYTFTYTVDSALTAPATITIGIASSGYAAFVTEAGTGTPYTPTGVSFDVIPEPMTIALLGLGGLLLRRRR